jgi:ubiquinone/menaquinone biosynthesis C-methylase UbiE
MSVFDGISSTYDVGMWPLEHLMLRRLRLRLFPRLAGDVLELGVGTGVNLPLYGPEARLVACDRSGEMLSSAVERRAPGASTFVRADVQQLPFPDARFDVVSASFLFCSVADPSLGLREARRVLRPAGRLVLLEHTRGTRGPGAWLTDALHPLWKSWSRECHLNRETSEAVAAAGFRIQRVERHALGIIRVIEAQI